MHRMTPQNPGSSKNILHVIQSIFTKPEEEENKKEDVKSLSKISEIDEVSMNTLHENSKSKLNGNGDNLKSYEKISEWESCGVYLFISKEDKTN